MAWGKLHFSPCTSLWHAMHTVSFIWDIFNWTSYKSSLGIVSPKTDTACEMPACSSLTVLCGSFLLDDDRHRSGRGHGGRRWRGRRWRLLLLLLPHHPLILILGQPLRNVPNRAQCHTGRASQNSLGIAQVSFCSHVSTIVHTIVDFPY